MASALQKLFRKRISKQQVQEQRQKQQQQQQQQQQEQEQHQRVSSTRKRAEAKVAKDGQQQQRFETQPYLTVSSLNSPSSSSSYFPFSSKLSLDSCSALSIADGQSTPTYYHQTYRESSSSAYHDIRPRAASLSAQSMLRDASDNSRAGWSKSAGISERDLRDSHVDQFGNLVSSEQQHLAAEKDDEDDLEANAIYSALSRRPSLKLDWEKTKLVLVPSRTETIGEEEMASDGYIALHAFVPSTLFKDQYVSVRSGASSSGTGTGNAHHWTNVALSVTLESENRSVHIHLSDAAQKTQRTEYDIVVRGETTIYRSMSTEESRESATSRIMKQSTKRPGMIRRERIRIRVLFLEEALVPERVHTQMMRGEKDQATSDGDLIAFPHQVQAETVSTPPPSPLLPLGREKQDDIPLVPSSRHFALDFAFLLDPPARAKRIEKPLRSALDTLVRAASEFTKAYVYVSGFDAYNVSRIRKGILAKAWQSFETDREADLASARSDTDFNTEDQARLLSLLENVVMGHCHSKVYMSIRSAFQRADEHIDRVIATYQALNVSLEDFGVRIPALSRQPSLLQDAIFAMQYLGEPDEDLEQILEEADADNLRTMAKLGDVHRSPLTPFTAERSGSRVRTPLDVLDVLHTTMEQIGSVLDKAQKSSTDVGRGNRSSFGTDELLPVVTYVVVQAGCSNLASLLYYVRLFGLSDVTSSHFKWALVTNEAVLEYLRKDPLQLCAAKSPASSVRAVSPQSPGLYYAHDALLDNAQIDSTFILDYDARGRRNSLPTDALLAAAATTPSADAVSPEPGGSPMPSSASVYELRSSTSLSSESTTFKTPGRPASSYAERPRSRLISALDSVGEDGIVNVVTSSAASLAHSFSGRKKLSRRTTSMSGSSDLMIRPQIVVRSRTVAAAQRSQQQVIDAPQSADDTGSKERRTGRATEKRRADSSRMSRTNSEESPIGRMGAGTPNGIQGHLKQARRQSVDSWNSFSFFGGQAVTPERSSAARKETSPTSSVASHSLAAPVLASPSFSWLSSWSSDWGQGNRKDIRQVESCELASPTAPESVGRHDSDAESKADAFQSPDIPLREWAFPQSSSANSKLSSLAPTLPSPSSPKYLTSDHARRDMLYQPNAARKTPSLCSNTSSSSHSHQPPILGNSSSSNINIETTIANTEGESPSPSVDIEKRKRRSSRVRLLSTSRPGAPLPPQVYPELASGGRFHRGKIDEGETGSRSSKPTSKDGKRLLLSYSLASSPSLAAMGGDDMRRVHHQHLSDLQPDLEDMTPRSLSPTFAFFPPTLGTIQVPTPVDENTDPMARFPLTT